MFQSFGDYYHRRTHMSYINELAKDIHHLAKSKGWWDGQDIHDPNTIAAKICLVHSELSEALECVRDGETKTQYVNSKPEGLPVELADALIRILDLMEALGVEDIQGTIEEKIHYNRTRTHKHGGRAL